MKAREAYVEAGDRLAAAGVVARLAGVRHLLGDGLQTVRPLLEREIAELEDLGGDEVDVVRARLEAALAAACTRALDLPATELHATRAIELARQPGDAATELDALCSLVAVRPFAGRIDEALRIATWVIARCRELHVDDEAGRAFRLAGAGLSEVFVYDLAERWLRDGIAFAEQYELWNHRCYMTAHLGLVLWATGRWAEADGVAAAALREGRGGVTTRITGLYVRGYVALARGRLEEADGYLRESLAIGERSGDILRVSLPLWGLAESALLAGRVQEAVELTDRGRAASAPVDDAALLAPFLVTGTRARLAASGSREATAWVEELGRVLADSGVPDAGAGDRPWSRPRRARERRDGPGADAPRRRDPRAGTSADGRGRGPGRGWISRPATCARDGSARRWRCWPTSGPSPTRSAADRWPTGRPSCCATPAAAPPAPNAGRR